MSVTGLCEICEANTAEYGCDLCGRQVCGKHYSETNDICTVCLGEQGPEPSDQGEQEDMPDGVDTYEF